MKVTVYGAGYVGLVQAALFAEVGHDVMCVDVDEEKVDALNDAIVFIYEPGLSAIVKKNIDAGRLSFTTKGHLGVQHSELHFIAVGTPSSYSGDADLSALFAVVDLIIHHMARDIVIVNKSTVPIGTADHVTDRVSQGLAQRGVAYDFDVISNPEFLKEGSAVSDFRKPDRIVVGAESERAKTLMSEVYAPFNRNHDKMMFMDVRSAELTKYAANCFLATKISFMNEMANVAEKLGADIEMVRKGIGSDPRIGYHFIYPGCGYGGSCFPKDVRALAKSSEQASHYSELLCAVESVNQHQKQKLCQYLLTHFDGCLDGKTIAVWGLAFKPNTDDMREAPSRNLMEMLWSQGAKVQAFDPEAMPECRRLYGKRQDLVLMSDKESALNQADALVICTEWNDFWAPDFDCMAQLMVNKVIVDGRNLFDPVFMKDRGFIYYAIGRGESVQLP